MRQNAGLLTQHISSIITPIFRNTLVHGVNESGHFLRAAYTTNSPALHTPADLQVWTPETGIH
jgi:hypothetical protein